SAGASGRAGDMLTRPPSSRVRSKAKCSGRIRTAASSGAAPLILWAACRGPAGGTTPAPRSAAVNERPGRDLRARLARDLDEGGSIVRKGTLERAAQLPRSRGAVACRTEGLGELHEVGIAQRFAEKPSAEGGLLVAQHIAEAVVVEHDRHGADAMLHGGGQLLHSEHEAAVAVDRYHRPGRIRDLDAERGHIAEAEV